MANSIVTIEIATQIKAALDAIVPEGTVVYARGVPTDVTGKIADAVKREVAFPAVDIIMAERTPHTFKSALQSYGVRIRAMTHYPSDQFQVTLYTLAQVVGNWVTSGPSLTLSLTNFDALVAGQAPEVGNTGDNDFVQYMEWSATVNVRKAV